MSSCKMSIFCRDLYAGKEMVEQFATISGYA
jgi:hypothetical protein